MRMININRIFHMGLTLILLLALLGCGGISDNQPGADSRDLSEKYGISLEALGFSGPEPVGLTHVVTKSGDGLRLAISVEQALGTSGAVLAVRFDENAVSPASLVGGNLLNNDALTLLADTESGEVQIAVASVGGVPANGSGDLAYLQLDLQPHSPRTLQNEDSPADPPDDFLLVEYIGDEAQLSWSGVLSGDYNLDGKTDGFDLFPVSVLFQIDDGQPEYDPCVDGTNDGIINGLDVFPISSGFNRGITSYRLYQGLDSFGMEFVREIPRISEFPGCGAEYSTTVSGVEDIEMTIFGLSVFDGISVEESWMAWQPDGDLSVEVHPLAFYESQAPTGMNVDCTVRYGRAPYEFFWSLGGGQSADTKEANATWIHGGNFLINVTVEDALGAQASDNDGPVSILPPPVVEIESATLSPLSGLVPLFVQGFSSADGGVGILNYVWTWGDGSEGNANNAAHTYDDSGSFAVKLTVTDAIGQSDFREWTVEVSYPPLDAGEISAAPTSGEVPFTTSFNIEPSGGKPPYYYTWNFGVGPPSFDKSPSYTFTFEGDFEVSCTVTDSQSSQVQRTIDIHADPPYMTATLHADPSEADAPVWVNFWATIEGGQAPYEYEWNFGGGNTSTEESPSHFFTTAGHHTVRCTITDDTGYELDAPEIEVYCPQRVKSLSLDVQPIINGSCMGDEPGDCHNGLVNDSGLDLTTDVFWSNTVNQIAVRAGDHYIVQPYNSDLSFLLRKIAYSHEEYPFDQYSNTGDGMPPTGKMQNQYIQAIGGWIEEGAKDN